MFKQNILLSLSKQQVLPPDFDANDEFEKRIHLVQEVSGMIELLEKLSSTYHLAINSSSHSIRVRKLLAKFDLEKYFDVVLGGEEERSKTKKMIRLMDKYNCSVEETIFITDTAGDISEAQEISMDTIGVTWGFHNRKYFMEVRPTYICDSPSELQTLLSQLNTNQ